MDGDSLKSRKVLCVEWRYWMVRHGSGYTRKTRSHAGRQSAREMETVRYAAVGRSMIWGLLRGVLAVFGDCCCVKRI